MVGPRLTGPRLTGPAAQLARSITTTTHSGASPQAATLITSSKAAAPLSRKYAELLKERNQESDHSRHIYTRSANRPHPAPQRIRLMQTFTSSASRPARSDVSTIDFMVLPDLRDAPSHSTSRPRVPIMPDNYNVHYAPETIEEPVLQGQINVIAADPEKVSVSALTEIEGMTLDGVELKFAHENSAEQESEPGMLKDLWKGLVDDVLGGGSKGKLAM